MLVIWRDGLAHPASNLCRLLRRANFVLERFHEQLSTQTQSEALLGTGCPPNVSSGQLSSRIVLAATERLQLPHGGGAMPDRCTSNRTWEQHGQMRFSEGASYNFDAQLTQRREPGCGEGGSELLWLQNLQNLRQSTCMEPIEAARLLPASKIWPGGTPSGWSCAAKPTVTAWSRNWEQHGMTWRAGFSSQPRVVYEVREKSGDSTKKEDSAASGNGPNLEVQGYPGRGSAGEQHDASGSSSEGERAALSPALAQELRDRSRPLPRLTENASNGGEEIESGVLPAATSARKVEENMAKTAQLAQAIMGGMFDGRGRLREDEEAEVAEQSVPVEAQRCLRVGIIGAPNAGKSVLTNALVGRKVSIVSRKTNTTRSEVLGVTTCGPTQLLYFDTPGVTWEMPSQPLKRPNREMAARAWQLSEDCEVLLLLVDSERQVRRPDPRVRGLVERVGSELPAGQKRVVCLNKVDLVRDKRGLLPLADWLHDFHAFDRVFMTSGLKGSGVRQLQNYLFAQAVPRPWEEDPGHPSELSPQEVAVETVREALLDRLHQELPYTVEQRLSGWRSLEDGSLRVEQQLLVASEVQRAMVVGHQGQTVRQIGINARVQLEELFQRKVHLLLNVVVKNGR